MKLAILVPLLAVPLFAQDKPKEQPVQPAPSTPQAGQFLRVDPKVRKLSDAELHEFDYLRAKYENLARAACESIGVRYQDCDIQAGVVFEKPKQAPPPNQAPAAPAATATQPTEKK